MGQSGGHLGVVQNEFLKTWSCYISSESIFDADFEFFGPILIFALGGQSGVLQNESLQTW